MNKLFLNFTDCRIGFGESCKQNLTKIIGEIKECNNLSHLSLNLTRNYL